MKSSNFIRRLLAVLMIVGIALAPLSRPAMAETVASASTQAMVSDDAVAMSDMVDDMAEDMPCCPSKSSSPAVCDKCVLMASCAAKSVAGVFVFATRSPLITTLAVARPMNDSWPDGLGQHPPDQPPRISI